MWGIGFNGDRDKGVHENGLRILIILVVGGGAEENVQPCILSCLSTPLQCLHLFSPASHQLSSSAALSSNLSPFIARA